LAWDQHRLFGVDPPHEVVFGGEPIRVLKRQLGLAHSAQPVERLHHQCGLPGPQPLPQLGQQVVAAGEVRIAGRQVPSAGVRQLLHRPAPDRTGRRHGSLVRGSGDQVGEAVQEPVIGERTVAGVEIVRGTQREERPAGQQHRQNRLAHLAGPEQLVDYMLGRLRGRRHHHQQHGAVVDLVPDDLLPPVAVPDPLGIEPHRQPGLLHPGDQARDVGGVAAAVADEHEPGHGHIHSRTQRDSPSLPAQHSRASCRITESGILYFDPPLPTTIPALGRVPGGCSASRRTGVASLPSRCAAGGPGAGCWNPGSPGSVAG
jgi:hypothetical protein